jgi:RNA polymerase sigma-70 factor (ECF subfamily)
MPEEGNYEASKQEIAHLLEQVGTGSQEAVRELLDEYGEPLLKAIRRRLAPTLRSQFDSADFVQAVWASFFAVRWQDYHFNSPTALMNFLISLAHNKLSDVARQRLQTRKRNQNRVHSLDGSAAAEAFCVTTDGPTPSQLVLAQEQWDRVLQSQPPHYRRMLQLLRQGHTQQEVAAELDINEKTVRRVVDRVARLFGPGGRS